MALCDSSEYFLRSRNVHEDAARNENSLPGNRVKELSNNANPLEKTLRDSQVKEHYVCV